MLKDRVKCNVPNPNVVNVGSVITLGTVPTGYRSFLSAFGAAVPAYFVLSDGAGRTITGVWTVNSGPETATITEIIWNDRLGNTSGETFSTACVAWNALPAQRAIFIGVSGITPLIPVGTSLEYSGTTLPAGFLWEDGANHNRTTYAALFAAIGTTYGAGNGSTTFGVPDSRGRISVGRDNMGGTTASRVTAGVSGITGTTLGAVGGDERLHSHGHSVSDPGHGHGISDPGHAHGVTDPGHSHTYITRFTDSGSTGGSIPHWESQVSANTNAVGTGISINGAVTSVSVNGAVTSLSIVANGAGASQNMPPSIVKNKIIFAGV